jgi:hypothetical protein
VSGRTRNTRQITRAIVIFGGWHPVRVMVGCFAFGVLPIVRLKVVGRFAEHRPGFHRAVIGDPPRALGQPFHT